MISDTFPSGGQGRTPAASILGKPVFFLPTDPFNEHSGFIHKKLSDGPTFTPGTACAYSCRYCYVESMVLKHPGVRRVLSESGLDFNKLVIRREKPLQRLAQVLTQWGTHQGSVDAPEDLIPKDQIEKWGLKGEWSVTNRVPRFRGPTFKGKVVFGSPLVDLAATPELAQETVELCELLLRLTSFHLRLLSKSPHLAHIVAVGLVERLGEEARKRVIFGLSSGTLDDKVAAAIEPVPPPSERLKALYWLQDNGFRTYGMLCPILPQQNARAYADAALRAIRADKCEEIWAEPVNFRAGNKGEKEKDGDPDEAASRDSFSNTLNALIRCGHLDWAGRFKKVAEDDGAWENYCRQTFEALRAALPGTKELHWLQYPRTHDVISEYWEKQEPKGALLLGATVTGYRISPFRFRKALVDFERLAEVLKDKKHQGAGFVWSLMPEGLRNLFHNSSSTTRRELDGELLKWLNRIIKSSLKSKTEPKHSLYDKAERADVSFSAETKALHAREHELPEWELVHINRLLLEDCLPGAFKTIERRQDRPGSPNPELQISPPVGGNCPARDLEADNLTPAQKAAYKAWETIRERYTPDQIRARAKSAAEKARKTTARKKHNLNSQDGQQSSSMPSKKYPFEEPTEEEELLDPKYDLKNLSTVRLQCERMDDGIYVFQCIHADLRLIADRGGSEWFAPFAARWLELTETLLQFGRELRSKLSRTPPEEPARSQLAREIVQFDRCLDRAMEAGMAIDLAIAALPKLSRLQDSDPEQFSQWMARFTASAALIQNPRSLLRDLREFAQLP